jgi:DNA-binding MarR family transcriptional regulator
MEHGGRLSKDQHAMAKDLGVSQQTISNRLAPLCDLNLVLRPDSPKGHRGNQYRVHPLAAKYKNASAMEAAVTQALADIMAGKLPRLRIALYQEFPPSPGHESPGLGVAS